MYNISWVIVKAILLPNQFLFSIVSKGNNKMALKFDTFEYRGLDMLWDTSQWAYVLPQGLLARCNGGVMWRPSAKGSGASIFQHVSYAM